MDISLILDGRKLDCSHVNYEHNNELMGYWKPRNASEAMVLRYAGSLLRSPDGYTQVRSSAKVTARLPQRERTRLGATGKGMLVLETAEVIVNFTLVQFTVRDQHSHRFAGQNDWTCIDWWNYDFIKISDGKPENSLITFTRRKAAAA